MTTYQMIILGIILYSIATTFFIIFQAFQLYNSRKENDELSFEKRMFERCLQDNLTTVAERSRTDSIFLPN